MKNRLFAALVCAFVVLCSVSVFADTEAGLGGAAEIIIGEQSDNTGEVTDAPSQTEPPQTDPSQTEPVTTVKPPEDTKKPPETSKTPEPTKGPEPTKAPETTAEPDTAPATQTEPPSDVVNPEETQDTPTRTPEVTKDKPDSTTRRDKDSTKSTGSSSDSESESTSAVTTAKKDEVKSGSRFSSPTHVIAFILGIPTIISFYALVAVIARRIIYRDTKTDDDSGKND